MCMEAHLVFVSFILWFHVQVLANMNAAYKQEKKNAKRKSHNMSPVTFKAADPMFSPGEAPSLKKVKEERLYLTFPVETVLATEQSSSEDVKTELVYHLAESDVS